MTAPLNFQSLTEGHWESSVQLKDKRKKREYPLSIDFTLARSSDRRDLLRMDLTTPTGFYIATLVVNGGSFKAISAREKKFYSGEIKASIIARVLKVAVDPRWFRFVILDQPPVHWDCQYNSKRVLQECSDDSVGLKVYWSERERARKKIVLQLPDYELTISLRGYRPKVERADRLFTLKRPPRFQHLRLK